MSNVVAMRRLPAAAGRFQERVARAARKVKPAHAAFVEELVAAMVEASLAKVAPEIVVDIAIGAINDVMQDFAVVAKNAQARLQQDLDRVKGKTS